MNPRYPYAGSQRLDACGVGTPWGCGRMIEDGALGHIILDAVAVGGPRHNRHRLFHLDCCPVCSGLVA